MRYLYEFIGEGSSATAGLEIVIPKVINFFKEVCGFEEYSVEVANRDYILFLPNYNAYMRVEGSASTSNYVYICVAPTPVKSGHFLTGSIHSKQITASAGSKNSWLVSITLCKNEDVMLFGFSNASDRKISRDFMFCKESNGIDTIYHVASFSTTTGGLPSTIVSIVNGESLNLNKLSPMIDLLPSGENKALYRDCFAVGQDGHTDVTYKWSHIHNIRTSQSYTTPAIITLNEIEYFMISEALVMRAENVEYSVGGVALQELN